MTLQRREVEFSPPKTRFRISSRSSEFSHWSVRHRNLRIIVSGRLLKISAQNQSLVQFPVEGHHTRDCQFTANGFEFIQLSVQFPSFAVQWNPQGCSLEAHLIKSKGAVVRVTTDKDNVMPSIRDSPADPPLVAHRGLTIGMKIIPEIRLDFFTLGGSVAHVSRSSM